MTWGRLLASLVLNLMTYKGKGFGSRCFPAPESTKLLSLAQGHRQREVLASHSLALQVEAFDGGISERRRSLSGCSRSFPFVYLKDTWKQSLASSPRKLEK